MKFKEHSFLISISFIILSITFSSFLLPIRSFSEVENRFLQTKPNFTIKSYLTSRYTKEFQSFINDQFPFRDTWIKIKSKTELLLDKKESNGIIYGSNHYLFKRFDTINRKNIAKNTWALVTFTNAHPNIPTYFILIPNSYAILSDLLPPHILKVDQPKCINYIYKYLRTSCNIQPINIIPAFFHHHEDYIYYRTDHHWTNIGAYLASYNFIYKTKHVPLFPNPLDIACNEVPNFLGTYFNQSLFTDVQPDIIHYIEPNVSVFIDGTPYPSLYDVRKWSSRDKYAAFLWGNNSLTTIINNDLPKEGRHLLLIKDSFGNSAAPYLTYNYRQIDIIDLRSINFNLSDYLKENNFDEILIMYNFTTFNDDRNISKLNY